MNLASFNLLSNSPSIRLKQLTLGLLAQFDPITFGFSLSSTGCPSSETQEQLVGATGFSWAKAYNTNGRGPGHLLLSNEFQKRLKSCSLIGQKNQSEGGISNATGTRSVRVNAQGLFRSCCKLSPVKIPSPQLAAPGSPRMQAALSERNHK